ncbi:Zn-dependent alcohol dehydrogenase [Ramlibacter ginsenosidimutans]|uniref:Zn-dependent alcohol dehydrogenase n=1 Tax=Ramlibacter ginsenosidimutans TaxID=502333 RepID=A0A934TQC6_9BURK|nr:Zn-dependent alcohol dehydrogenase [Ramlibacter ginsenosidimutans]MBK6005011.1 Zn-dependent alcohol dehydrogenase [Ramlibacter ginsenosidimutans]
MEFRAAVLEAGQRPLVIARVKLERLAPTDVLIRNRASGLCHTDLEVIQGSLPYPLPIVLGHEGAGIVEEVGSAVTQVRPGDHVVASWNPHCGHCFYCERDLPILCEPFTRHQPAGHLLDGASRLTWNGAKLHHFSVVSSHAEYSVVPESGAIAVPREMPFDRACLIGCGVMTGVGAACRLAKVEAGSNVVVVGCGAVGLNAIQGALLQQAGTLVAVDRDPARLELARRFGATHTVPADDTTIAQVKDLTSGRGADYVFEAAGSEASLQLALEVTRPGAQCVILGKTEVNRKVALRFGSLMGEKRITRSSYGGARPRRDFPWLAQLYLAGKLDLDGLISTRAPLEGINDGFDAMRRGEGIRHVIVME